MSRLTLVFVFLTVVSLPASASFNLDIDDDGKTDALTDGLIILRYMFGLSGEPLVVGVIGSGANRANSEQILSYLAPNDTKLDIDGDGSVDALTDGLLILRNLFGLSDTALTQGVVSNNGIRNSSSSILIYINTIKDSDGDNVTNFFDAFPNNPDEWIDTDNDGIGNNEDEDDDGDGIPDISDPFPLDASASNDTDMDGIADIYDPDDDGDGIIDEHDVLPKQKSVSERITIDPWINEIFISTPDWANGDFDINLELVASIYMNCANYWVGFVSESGETFDEQHLWDLSCEKFTQDGPLMDRINNYYFFRISTLASEQRIPAAFFVRSETQCLEVVVFLGTVGPTDGHCSANPIDRLPAELANPIHLERSGVGVKRSDFSVWHIVSEEAVWQQSHHLTHDFQNHYQIFKWAEPETSFRQNHIDLGVLEFPKPRNTIVKSLQNAHVAKPMRNINKVKGFIVNEINSDVLDDDGESTYLFWSKKIRADLLDYMSNFALDAVVKILGSPRANNFGHFFDFPDDSLVLKNLAIERGHYDARQWTHNNFVFAGQGGGYFGMSEDSYWNGKLRYIEDDGSVNEWLPRKVFDNSVGNGFWAPDEYLLEGSELSLMDPAGGAGSYRENISHGWIHEFFHNWEGYQEIVASTFGPKRFSHPRADWGDNPIMHGPSTIFPDFILENVINQKDYDGYQNLWSMDRNYGYAVSRDKLDDYAQEFRDGNQSYEWIWAYYLVKNFGLEKMYAEYYRRLASAGDWRVALHQTFGKYFDELFEDANNWMQTVNSVEQLSPSFASVDDFKEALNISYNVSFLQVRNYSSPNQHFRTVYTFLGEGDPDDVGSLWIPVLHSETDVKVQEDGVDVNLSTSEDGQLKINGHLAYFYSNDTSTLHAGGLDTSENWSAFTRIGEPTSNLFFPVSIFDHDSDGLSDDYDPEYQELFFTHDGRYKWDEWPTN